MFENDKKELIEDKSSQYSSWNELKIFKICTDIINKKICPNLPILYTYFILKNVKKNVYLNPNIRRKYNNELTLQNPHIPVRSL